MNEGSTTWAVVVGIEHYRRLRPAPGAVGSAQAAARWLQRLGVPDSQITLVFSVPDADRSVTVEVIENSFAKLQEVSGTRLFVFLSGLGVYQDSRLLLAEDAEPERMGRNLNVDAYIQWLRSLDFQRQFLFIDFMDTGLDRADTRFPTRGPPFTTPLQQRPPQNMTVVCFAAQPGEHAYLAGGQSLFMRQLMAGLDPEHPPPDTVYADPSTGARSVDLSRVMREHVIPSVLAEARKQGGLAQTPTIETTGPWPTGRLPIFSLAAVREWLTRYDSDGIGQTDLLDIRRDVDPLAALLASTKVSPPLAVGLFGDWGSGKSFFMRQLDRRVAQLANTARQAKEARPDSERFYGSQIVQIWFNAWHYAEANLWASLASRIFEGLADYLRVEASGTSAYREVLGLMSGLERERTQLRQAESRRDELRARLEEAGGEQAPDPGRQNLADFGEQHPELDEQLDLLAKAAGADKVATDVRQALDTARGIRRIGTRIRARWGQLDGDRGSRLNRTKLTGLLAGALLVGLVLFVWLLGRSADVAAVVSLVVPVLGSAAAVAKVLLDRTRDALQAVERALLAEQRRELDAAQQVVAAQQARVDRLAAEVEALDPLEQSSLYRFTSERYTSRDYREYLGILARIQRDLEALNRRLVEQEASAGPADTPLLRVERIILYIDDLDRCPPKQVVQVLQAVHLLLAFPLFVAVVGVDSRWLVRSLQREYAAVLSPDGLKHKVDEEGEYWASTPQQYLEKIFQIPLWLRPMEQQGFSRLVRGLFEERDDRGVRGEADRGSTAAPGGAAGMPLQQSASTGPREPSQASPDAAVPPQPQTAVPTDDVAPRTLVITEAEQRFLEFLSPFVATPRSAKRLVNLYRLIKISTGEQRMAAFEGRPERPGEHQVAALLLAIVMGFPMQAPTLFQWLERAVDDATWPAFVDRMRPRKSKRDPPDFHSDLAGTMTAAEAAPWQQLCEAVDASSKLSSELAKVEDLKVFKEWLEPVGRYSFGVGRILSIA